MGNIKNHMTELSKIDNLDEANFESLKDSSE